MPLLILLTFLFMLMSCPSCWSCLKLTECLMKWTGLLPGRKVRQLLTNWAVVRSLSHWCSLWLMLRRKRCVCQQVVLKCKRCCVSLMCRWSHTDCRSAGPSWESSDAAAWDSLNSAKWAGPDGPAAGHLHRYTVKRTDPHVYHPHHAGQICAYLSTWCSEWKCLAERNITFSSFYFSTSRCVPASTGRCQLALRSWWVRATVTWLKFSCTDLTSY